MLKKKSVKILGIVLIVAVMLMTFGSMSFANISDGLGGTDFNNQQATDLANTVLGALKWAGVAIAIGMMIFLGIKYVTSSPEGKANLKGQLGIYILGLVFILAATVIVGILENAIV